LAPCCNGCRDRGAPGEVIVGKALDHVFAKARLVIEHIVGNAQAIGDGARIADVVARAAGALAPGGGAIIVKLQRDANHFGSARGGQARHHRAVHAARHGHHDAPRTGRGGKVEQRCLDQRGGIGQIAEIDGSLGQGRGGIQCAMARP
jgi:hypothetical protein